MVSQFLQLGLTGRYEECIAAFERTMPNHYVKATACLAAAYGQVGDKQSAHDARDRCIALHPSHTPQSFADDSRAQNPADREHWLNGLSKAELAE